jgi:hypothetical protein
MTKLIVSINVHEKPHFLLNQLKNIEQFVKDSFIVVLNCNDYMFKELTSINLPSNVHVNPEIINKKLWTGLITAGIYSNIKYALKNFDFAYFIVFSSRSMFYRDIRVSDLDNNTIRHDATSDLSNWHWPAFLETKLAQHYVSKNVNLYGSEHEGMVFKMSVCKNIQTFLENNIDISRDLFDSNVVAEEFALQTISMNEYSTNKDEIGWINIGHGVQTHSTIPTDPTLFCYKVVRN